jgi:hypothetical protein
LRYGFLDEWWRNGQLPGFGYPLSEECSDPATGLTVQYCERARLEWHHENEPPWNVLLGRLGAQVLDAQSGACRDLVTSTSL